MPVPLIWLGAGLASAYAGGALAKNARSHSVVDNYPGESQYRVTPVDGCVVCCGIYGVFEHTGIWCDDQIIELHGNGLVKAVGPTRFLHQRSGSEIYVACDDNYMPLVAPECDTRAVNQVFQYIEYDPISNNCHRFSLRSVTGVDQECVSFYEFNQKLSKHFKQNIRWQPIQLR